MHPENKLGLQPYNPTLFATYDRTWVSWMGFQHAANCSYSLTNY